MSQNSQENNCTRISFLIKLQASAWGLQSCNFIKKQTLALVFSCEFCEISKNTFFTEHLWTTASVNQIFFWKLLTRKDFIETLYFAKSNSLITYLYA